MPSVWGWITAFFGSFFGGQSKEPIAGRPWWLDPRRHTKSRLKQNHRVMRQGHGIKLSAKTRKRITQHQQQLASQRRLGRVA